MTKQEVAALLNTTIEEVEELGDELGVPDDAWTPDDVFEADRLLDEGEEEDCDE
jgi:hypothetical protein